MKTIIARVKAVFLQHKTEMLIAAAIGFLAHAIIF